MKTHTFAPLAVFALAALGTASCAAPGDTRSRNASEEVRYSVGFPAPQTQMVEITYTFPTGGRDSVEAMLPVWRPGRYEILDPAGTVRDVTAKSEDGTSLDVRKSDKTTWVVDSRGADQVAISYSIYANSIGTRTRHVDASHAFLSGSSVFLYSPPVRSLPVRIEIDAPEEWDIAGGLEFAEGETSVLVADSYDVLVDTPLELGLHDRIRFDVDEVAHEIIIWPPGVGHDAERMVEDITKIIREHVAVFGSYPYSRYVFLIHAGAGGGGTEHLNSTIMQTSRAAIEGSRDNSSSYKSFLGLVSHEFFHTWNVKQLRPAGIHPYNYQGENYTDLLWVAEGTTSYYGGLTLARAGLTKEKKYLDGVASAIGRQRKLPGNRVQSVAEASFDAWVKFSARGTDSTNSQVSFYSKGSLISLLLDMRVRAATDGRVTLDDVMRSMFERYPLTGPGYSTEDLVSVLDQMTGASFADFMAKYVSGREPLPFEDALLEIGLELSFEETTDEDKESEDSGDASEDDSPSEETDEDAPPKYKAYLGLRLSGGGSGSTVRTVLSDGPAYAAGLNTGDEILTMNGRRLRSGDLDARLKQLEPGDTVRLHFLRMDELHVLDVELTGVLDGKWSLGKVDEPTDAQRSAYTSWIGIDWPAADADEAEDED